MTSRFKSFFQISCLIVIACLCFSSCSKLAESGPELPDTDIVGTVLSDTGEPVIGAAVSLVSKTGYTELKATETDESGAYFFSDVDTGFYSIYVSASGEAGVLQNVYYYSSHTGEYVLNPITLTRKTGVIGTITYEGDGIADINVYLKGTPLASTSNVNGLYSISGIPDGDFELTVVKLGYKETTVTFSVTESLSSTLDLDDIALEVETRTGNVIGTVDLEGKNDDSGVLVQSNDYDASTYTESNGTYSLTLPLGTYSSFTFSKQDFTTKTVTDEVTVREGGNTGLSTVSLSAHANTVEGNATIHGKTSYEGVTVEILDTDFSTSTDVSGNYQFSSVPFDTYTVQFSYPDASTLTKIIVVEPADSIEVEDVVLLPAGDVTGIINLDLRTDYSSVTVSVTQGDYTYQTTTQTSGSYSFSSIPIGTYTLSASIAGYETGTTTFNIAQGETTQASLVTLYDTIAPLTSDDVDSTWVNIDVGVAFSVIDLGVGNLNTYWIKDGVTYNVVENGSPLYTAEGEHTISYYSVDKSNNQETLKTSQPIRIDKTIEIESVSENTQGVKKKLGETVRFMVDTNEPAGSVTVSIQNLVLTLLDDGTNGDETADDGIYALDYVIDTTTDAKADQITAVFVDKATNITSSILVGPVSMDGIVPVAPADVSLVPTSHEIEVVWSANSEYDIAGYNVWRSTTESGSYEKVNQTLVTGNSYVNDGLDNLDVYYYYVTAVDENGNESTASNKEFAFAASFRYGTLTLNEQWVPYDNPFIMMDDVIVPDGLTVSASAGVEIWGYEGSSLTVKGRLVAEGTSSEPITVTSYFEQGESGYWDGIDIETSIDPVLETASLAGSWLEYVNVVHTNGLTVSNGGSAFIVSCNITDNEHGVHLIDTGDTVVKANLIYENEGSGIWGEASDGKTMESVTITANIITAHPEHGVVFAGHNNGSITDVKINGNTFEDNEDTAIKTSGESESTFSDSEIVNNSVTLTESLRGGTIIGVHVTGESNEVLWNTITGHYMGVKIEDATNSTVKNNAITASTAWAISMEGNTTDGLIESNTITDNGYGLRIGESTVLSTVKDNLIRYNLVKNNTGVAFQINNTPQTEIELNNIYNNKGNGKNQVEIRIEEDIEFDSNYWNTQNPNTIKSYIYDFYDNDDVGKIIWQPALEEAAPAGVGVN